MFVVEYPIKVLIVGELAKENHPFTIDALIGFVAFEGHTCILKVGAAVGLALKTISGKDENKKIKDKIKTKCIIFDTI
jgi:hypothetical protein